MSSENAKKALNGVEAWIEGDTFEITENMTMTFEGLSCNIKDGEGNLVTLGKNDGRVSRLVYAGSRCYVIKASVKFTSTV